MCSTGRGKLKGILFNFGFGFTGKFLLLDFSLEVWCHCILDLFQLSSKTTNHLLRIFIFFDEFFVILNFLPKVLSFPFDF